MQYLRYHRTAHRMISPLKCRHLKSPIPYLAAGAAEPRPPNSHKLRVFATEASFFGHLWIAAAYRTLTFVCLCSWIAFRWDPTFSSHLMLQMWRDRSLAKSWFALADK